MHFINPLDDWNSWLYPDIVFKEHNFFFKKFNKKNGQNAGNRISDGLNFKIAPLYQFQWPVPSFSISWIRPWNVLAIYTEGTWHSVESTFVLNLEVLIDLKTSWSVLMELTKTKRVYHFILNCNFMGSFRWWEATKRKQLNEDNSDTLEGFSCNFHRHHSLVCGKSNIRWARRCTSFLLFLLLDILHWTQTQFLY